MSNMLQLHKYWTFKVTQGHQQNGANQQFQLCNYASIL